MSPNHPDYDKTYPPIPYTVEDIQALVIRLEAREPVADRDFESDNLKNFLVSRLNTGVFQGPATEERKRRFMASMEDEYFRVYRAMFLDRLEDMPLLINDPELDVIAAWRLEVAK